jgi:hypothetical protein
VLSTGALSAALRARPGALTEIMVAVSGTLAFMSVTLAARIVASSRQSARAHSDERDRTPADTEMDGTRDQDSGHRQGDVSVT